MEQMFFNRFPTKENLIDNFKPANWWKFLGNEERCVKAPTVTLGRIDSLYNSQDLRCRWSRNRSWASTP